MNILKCKIKTEIIQVYIIISVEKRNTRRKLYKKQQHKSKPIHRFKFNGKKTDKINFIDINNINIQNNYMYPKCQH